MFETCDIHVTWLEDKIVTNACTLNTAYTIPQAVRRYLPIIVVF